ncbi:MAG: exodeoxyribonuclease VII small subunit [Marivibrio sp.]|uniref:exodeoxyribonuclease VII small subunit n=1 Tax=Marivibrio sp. TaxID=2039719 RepID=UPI0032EDCB0D
MAEKKADAIPDDIQAMSFEQAMHELEEIVQAMERGDAGLDEAIDRYTRGAQLKRHCEAKLKEAKARVEKITVGADGGVSAEDADLG